MSNFVSFPLEKLLNRENYFSRVERLEQRTDANPSATVGQLGQISQSTGNLVIDGQVVIVDGDDGLPNVTMDRDGGITLRNQVGAIIFQNLTGTAFDNVQLFIDSFEDLVLANAVGGKGIRFDVDNAAHSVHQHSVIYEGINLDAGKYYIDSVALGYSLTATSANNTPADATTYYFGAHPGTAFATTASRRRVYIPRAGTVKRVDLFFTFVAGSNEQSTMSFRLNDTSDTSITTTLDLSTNPVAVTNSSLSIAVAAGDFFEIKWVTPTWATNPTSVSVTAQVWIEF